ncbi:MAG: DUF6362 family protein [Paracoccus sp. (in: a-proteobacteria)]|nr:DUF6362 family protein [Paracoccus sp. (in: a-proteobacteria)]
MHEAKHAYGYHEARMRVVPSPAEIQRMEDCLTWLRWLEPDDARIVWMRAGGCRWKQVCYRVGVVRQTACRRRALSISGGNRTDAVRDTSGCPRQSLRPSRPWKCASLPVTSTGRGFFRGRVQLVPGRL